MNTADQTLTIELKEGKSRFRQGECVRGKLCWNTEESGLMIDLRLGWYVHNDTYRDIMSHCVQSYKIHSSVGTTEFEVIIPSGPHSYVGQLFSVTWLLEARSRDGKYLFQFPLEIKPESMAVAK